MKIAVYDRYWSTAGGGEKFAAGVAHALAADHDVTLLAHEALDTAWLGERLAVDLSGVAVEHVGEAGRLPVATEAYDLLVNLSYRSSDANGARRGIYVVHFPHDRWVGFPPRQRRLLERAGPLVARAPLPYAFGPGFHGPEILRASKVRWTDGDGELRVSLPPGARSTVHLLLGRLLPPGRDVSVAVEVDDRPAAQAHLAAARRRGEQLVPHTVAVPVVGHDDGSPTTVRLRSGTWVPAEVSGGDDHRRLGVPVVGVAVGRRPDHWLRAVASLFEEYPPPLDFLDSYHLILANSAFTQRWIRTSWGRDSELLYPPVSLRTPVAGPVAAGQGAPAKHPVVLSVGRFFAPERGHSKKQRELVEGWRRLLARPEARAVVEREGWSLHLVGGCSPADRPYLEEVRAAAEGLPVVFHVDASGEELDRLYREAALYWHGAGLGEDEHRHPERLEHFGITTVEAMSAGAVPVAYGAAGPLEAFRSGIEGYHFRTLEQLADATARLLVDAERRATMARAAVERAQGFGPEAFAARLRAHVAEVVAGPH